MRVGEFDQERPGKEITERVLRLCCRDEQWIRRVEKSSIDVPIFGISDIVNTRAARSDKPDPRQ